MATTRMTVRHDPETRAALPGRRAVGRAGLLVLLVFAGCTGGDYGAPIPHDPNQGGGGYSSYYTDGEIKFLDAAASNAPLDQGAAGLVLVTPDGTEARVQELIDERYLVLVVTRGNTVPICPYCSTQTAQLISGYAEFQSRGAQVAAVYPIETGADKIHLDAFLAGVRTRLGDPKLPVPFPVLLDVELKAVDALGIRKNLSKPATYIIDRAGVVRYAYVGEHLADRPSTTALLKELDGLAAADAPASGAGS